MSSLDANPIDEFDAENRQAYDALVQSFVSDKVVPLVGAGLSCGAGYPTWNGLLEALGEELLRSNRKSHDELQNSKNGLSPEIYAKELKTRLGPEAVARHIETIFKNRDPGYCDSHEHLMALPVRHILTTNYDLAIESACKALGGREMISTDLEDHSRSMPILKSITHRDPDPNCIHLHGSIRAADKIIFDYDDYKRLYTLDVRACHFLTTIATVTRLLFIGFSLNDESLMRQIERVTGLLGNTKGRHFVIIDAGKATNFAAERVRLETRFNIRPIFYPLDEGHTALPETLRRLCIDVKSCRIQVRKKQAAEHLHDSVSSSVAPISDGDVGNRAVMIELISSFDAARPLIDTGKQSSQRDTVDDFIDDVFQFVQLGQSSAAIQKYQDILEDDGVYLSPRHKYRISANIGNAHYASGEISQASRAYLEAAGHYLESKESRAIEILGYHLAGDDGTALRLSMALCEAEPEYARAHGLRIRVMPRVFRFDTVESATPASVRDDVEVSLALAQYAVDHKLVEHEERYLRIGVGANPDWHETKGRLAVHLLAAERDCTDIGPDGQLFPRRPKRVEEAVALLAAVIDNLPRADPGFRIAGYLLNRAIGYRLLGELDNAREDIRRAYDNYQDDVEIVIAEALERERTGNPIGAIRCLEEYAKGSSEFRCDLLLAQYLLEHDPETNRDRAISIINSWMTKIDTVQPPEYRADLCRLLVRCVGKGLSSEQVRQAIDAIPAGVLSFGAKENVMARLMLDSGERDDSVRWLYKAMRKNVSASHWLEVRELAQVAAELQEWTVAFSLLRDRVGTKRFGADTRSLIRAAYYAGEHKYLLAFLECLRVNEIHEWGCYQAEAEILHRYREPYRAMDLIKAWLKMHPKDMDARLVMSLVALEIGEAGMVESDASRLRSVGDVRDVTEGARVASVLLRSSRPEIGLRYAYCLWRRYPEAMDAHRTLVGAVFDPYLPSVSLLAPEIAKQGCAILIQEEGAAAKWIVLENEDEPRAAYNEYGSEHPLVLALEGLGVGDTFEYRGRTVQVLELKHCILYRAQQCLKDHEDYFPDNPQFREFRFNSSDIESGDPKKILGPVWEPLEKQEQVIDRFEKMYAQGQVSIAMMANCLGKPVFEAVRYNACRISHGVMCSTGAEVEIRAAIASLKNANAVMLDTTAVATIYLLGQFELVSSLPIKVLVARATIDELRDVVRGYTGTRSPASSLVSVQGEPLLIEHDPGRLAAEGARLQGYVDKLVQRCEIVGGLEQLGLEQGVRSKVNKLFDDASVDAMAVAHVRGVPLWTDDIVSGQCARSEMNVVHVSTPIIVHYYHAKGDFKDSLAYNLYEHLIRYGYEFVSLNSEGIVELLRKDNWDPRGGLAEYIYKQLAKLNYESPRTPEIYWEVIVSVWYKCPNEERSKSIIEQFLIGLPRDMSINVFVRGLARYPVPDDCVDVGGKFRRLKRFLRRWRMKN